MRKTLLYLTFLLLCSNLSAQNETAFIDAVQHFSDGDYKPAEEMFSMLHAKDSTDDASLYYLSLCEYSLGDKSSSEKHLLKACSLDSLNCWYLSALASLYNTQGRQAESARLCERLLRLKPASYRTPYTLTLIADSKLNEQNDSTALSYYEQALEIDPSYAPAEMGKAEIMRYRGNMPSYFLSLDKFIHNSDVYPDMKSGYLKAILERMDSRFYWVWGEQLGRLVDTCLVMHPEDVQSHVNKLNICFIERDTTGVYRQCEEIIPLAMESRDTTNLMLAMGTMADMYHSQGQDKMAFKTYERALAINPDYCPALNNYAYFLCLSGRKLKKALEMSRRTIELEPDNATYLDTYGWLLYLTGKAREAKPYFKHAMIYGGKESSVVLEHYSKVLEALGETDLSSYYKSLSEQKK